MNIFNKIGNIIQCRDKKEVVSLTFFMLIGIALETIGVGLITPIISIMMNKGSLNDHGFTVALKNYVNLSSENLIVLLVLGLALVYLIKNIYAGFVISRQMKFTFHLQERLSQRLYQKYLLQPYTFHLQRNSSELVSNLTGEVSYFSSVLISLMMLFSESLILICISALLFAVEPYGTLLVGVLLGGVAWLFIRITRKHVTKWGRERQLYDHLRTQHLNQGLHGVKDVILLGRQAEFLNQYQAHNARASYALRLQNTLQSYPRLIFEVLVVLGMALLVMSMLKLGSKSAEILPVLGLFAAASFRLMPSVNRILASIQTLRYSLPAVDKLQKEFTLSEDATHLEGRGPIENNLFQNTISIDRASFSYPNSASPSISNLSLTIKKGEFVGFIGSSGSGKTTLIDLMLGLIKPSAGQIIVDNIDIHRNLRIWQSQIGYVPQSIYLTDDTLRRNIAFGIPSDKIDDLALKDAVEAAQLSQFIGSLPLGLETIVGERGTRLSGGQRQRIGIARALYHRPSVLVLDEATSALDVKTEDNVMSSIMLLKNDKTIIVIAHRLTTVQDCDRLFCIEGGQLIRTGPPSALIIN